MGPSSNLVSAHTLTRYRPIWARAETRHDRPPGMAATIPCSVSNLGMRGGENLSKAKTNKETEVTEMLSGLQSTLPSTVKTFTVVGKSMTPQQVEAQLQSFLTLCAAVASAKAAFASAMANRKAQDPAITALMVGLRSSIKQLYPGDVVTLAKFGIDLKAKTKPSTLKKATTATKMQATKQLKKAASPRAESQVLLFGANGEPLNAPASLTPASAAPASAAPAASSSASGK